MKYPLLIILMMCSVFSNGQKGCITGKVVDKTGAILPYATIQIKLANKVVSGLCADSMGYYIFDSIQPGNYSVEVRALSYKTQLTKGVQVISGDCTEINSILDQSEIGSDSFIYEYATINQWELTNQNINNQNVKGLKGRVYDEKNAGLKKVIIRLVRRRFFHRHK